MAGFDREGAIAAGYTPEQVDAYLASKQEPMVSEPFLKRIAQGEAYNKALNVVGRVKAGAEKGWGNGELGFEAGSEMTTWLQKHGIFHDYSKGEYGGPITTFNEAIMRPSAMVLDAVARTFTAGTHAIGGLFGGIAEETGALDQGHSARLERDISTMGDVALILSGAMPNAPMVRSRVRPDGRVVDEPLGGFPKREDFGVAAENLSGGTKNAALEKKLTELYSEHGFHPAELALDAKNDPVLLQQLLSDDPGMPDRLVKRLPSPGEPPAGGAGKPPNEPPKGPPPGEEPRALPPPEDGSSLKPTGVEDSARLAREEILGRLSIDERYRDQPLTKELIAEWTVDKLFPLKQLEKTAKGAGIELETANAPYRLARNYSGWAGKAEVMLKHEGPFDFFSFDNVGPSLKEILGPLKADLDGFRAVVASARAIELDNRGLAHGMDVTAARTVLKNATTEQKLAARQIYDYQNHLAAYLRDSGVLSPRGYDAMVAANKYYVPFHALLDEEGLGVAAHGASLQPKNPIHRIKGADYKKIDPLESIIKNTFVLTAMAERNVVTSKTVALLRGLEEVVGELKPAPGRDVALREPDYARLEGGKGRVIAERADLGDTALGDPVRERLKESGMPIEPGLADFIAGAAQRLSEHDIAVYEKGVRKVYTVSPDIARAIKALDTDSVNWMIKALSYPATTLKVGAVVNPVFWARHIWRELFYASTTYEHGVYTPVDTFKALQGMVIRDQDYIDWMKGGGGHVSVMALDRAYLQENLRHLNEQTGLMERSWNVVGKTVSWAQASTETALSATHFGAFKKRMRQLEKEAAGKVATEAAEVEKWRLDSKMDAPRLGKFNTDNLPDTLKGKDLRLHPDAKPAETLARMFDMKWSPEEGKFVEMVVGDTAEKKRIIEAAWTSRDTSVDNTRIGSQMRALNMISAFANAKIQDVSRGGVESFMRRAPETAFAVSAGIVLPSALLWYANKDDSRVQSLPTWQRDMFWIVATDKWQPASPNDLVSRDDQGRPTGVRPADQIRINPQGQLEVNNGVLFRLPKPFLLGVLFGSGTERSLDAFAKDKPGAMKGYFDSLRESTIGDLVPNAVTPLLEQAMNRSRMGGQSVIPRHLEGLLPEYQYTPYTTEAAKKLGMLVSSIPGIHYLTAHQDRDALGGAAAAVSSPILIENMVRGWSGTLGDQALKTVDLALRKAGVLPDPPKAAGTLADVPFVKAFVVRYPSMGVEQVQHFYEALGDLQVMKRTFDDRLKHGDLAGVERMMTVGGPAVFMKFDQMKTAIQNQTKTINMINEAPETVFKPAEKRQLIDSLYFAIQQEAEQGLKQTREVRKALEVK